MQSLVVIGASAGGIEALHNLIAGLKSPLQSCILIVLHIANRKNKLPEILSRDSQIAVQEAQDDEPLQEGHIYIAPADRHLILSDKKINLVYGPKENGFRPAIDPLFFSAAEIFGRKAVGILLSGTLDDGVAGLQAIKEAGGTAIVQDPKEAIFPELVETAISIVKVDHVSKLDQISDFINQPFQPPALINKNEAERGQIKAGREPANSTLLQPALKEPFSEFGCPSCGGVLKEIEQSEPVSFRCRVGHSFTVQGLVKEQDRTLENALWSAVEALEEKLSLNRRLAKKLEKDGGTFSSRHFAKEAEKFEEYITKVRTLIYQYFSVDGNILN